MSGTNEIAFLRDQLEDADLNVSKLNHKLTNADKIIKSLKEQLKGAQNDNQKLNMTFNKMRKKSGFADFCSGDQSTQTNDKDITEMFLQLQITHVDLERCINKLQSSTGCTEEQHNKVDVLRKCLLDVSVKMQQELVRLMKKSIKLDLSNTDKDPNNEIQSAQADEVDRLNVQLQELHLELMQQSLKLNAAEKEYQEQQLQLEQLSERQDGDSAVTMMTFNKKQNPEEKTTKAQDDNDDLLLQIQQLEMKVLAEEALRIGTETKALKLEDQLCKANSALKNLEENAAKDQDDKNQLLFQIQMLDLKLSAEEALRMETDIKILELEDLLSKTHYTMKNLEENAARHEDGKDDLRLQVQQLELKLLAEETLRVEKETLTQKLEFELSKMEDEDVCLSDVQQLMEDLLPEEALSRKYVLKSEDQLSKAHHAKRNIEDALQSQMSHLRKMAGDWDSLRQTIDSLQQTQQSWTRRESCMVSRVDQLESRLTEILKKKNKKRRFGLTMLYNYLLKRESGTITFRNGTPSSSTERET